MAHPPHVPADASLHDDVDRLAAAWDAETPGIAGQAFMLAERVARLHARLDDVAQDRLAALGLSRAEHAALAALRSAGHPYTAPVDDDAAVAALVERGLVTSDPVPGGTEATATLTLAGEQVALSAVTAVVSGQAVALRGVPAGSLAAANAALRDALVALGG